MSDYIYKIAPKTLWAQAVELGRFNGSPLDIADGFIHFSAQDQVAETLNKHFAGQDDLILAAVDIACLDEKIIWEASRNGALFPHLYEPLDLAHVAWVRQILRGDDGGFLLPF